MQQKQAPTPSCTSWSYVPTYVELELTADVQCPAEVASPALQTAREFKTKLNACYVTLYIALC